ncbi:MAG: ABC transporter ATP-binding protein [Bacteroidota bacterium]|jgi:subfamily B ATP-binding cassette protein MsbA|nr:ABC transporter ATP-binding protein [Chitinophagaceae bacterium]MCA6489266.1 ABC transporter ATP-binding protein [Chitinophagaceae bacterium]MCA6491880.1 ABC transporter ATP-binding protein [Chitinophagaceae bacterium]MCA6494367.1 ABC transporter ATP-binding protein [Chitinophagaceae bacterium]MCA6496996.1 ABC transporter ATP-binding protein [Chitinophagaceae bacterium]
MKRFSRILFYLRSQRQNIVLYVLSNLFSVLFSLVSLAMLAPFLQMLFDAQLPKPVKPEFAFTLTGISGIKDWLDYAMGLLIVKKGKIYSLGVICLMIITAVFFKNLFTYLSFRVLAPMRNFVMTKLRADLYAKLLELPIGYFSEKRKGDIISRMSNDANEIEWSVMSTLEGLIREPLTIIIMLTVLVYISPTLSLFLLVLLPVTGFIIGRISRSLKKQSTISQETQGRLLSILDETLGGLRVIKAFNAESIMREKFFETNNKLNLVRNHMNFRKDLASPLSEFLGVAVLSCILWFGGQLVLGNQTGLSPGSFITYIVIFTQIIPPAKALSTAFYNAQRGSAAIQRIEEILQTKAAVTDAPDAISIAGFQKDIRLNNVSFGYDEHIVLKNIHLTIEKGKTIALVGSSGSGKSSLADLICRFHDVTDGEILIDGVNIKKYTQESIRRLMGIVTQEPILFNDTIGANITLGTDITDAKKIEQAARIANAWSFIERKEMGLEENIGDRGNKLSGGEKQRLTIARAVLKNPPILILDEATSSLDTESERSVQDAINHMMLNRTSLVIAHRLSTIRHADEIVVLHRGEIIERGTHEQLMNLQGHYKKLVDLQAFS